MLLDPKAAAALALSVVFLGCGSSEAAGPGGSTSSSSTAASTTSSTGSGTGGSGGAPTFADPYEILAFDDVRIGSDSTQPNFQRADADVELAHGPFESVFLSVALRSTCFPFESWQDNPPPPGENWPADCDAFDRNFEFSFDDPLDDRDPPGIEVLRAITPFGGPLSQMIDITDVANGLSKGPHRLRVVIPTWSDGAGQVSGSNGGWNVTASLRVTPGVAPRDVLAVIPLFNGVQSEPNSPAPIAFEVPEGAVSGRLEWRATGHGGGAVAPGCIGPAEEFCRRDHTLLVDGAILDELSPWRQDCSDLCTITHYGPPTAGFDYCAENPCGAIQSVRAQRANWCPGSATPPFTWDDPPLGEPGPHDFSWQISAVEPGGSWRLSAVYFAFGP